jgi:6-phosphogluconate dehydrogenase
MPADFELGLVGLGVMGRNLLLNLADHGHRVLGLDRSQAKIARLNREGDREDLEGVAQPEALVAGLRRPRAILMMVPAGDPVDSVIAEMVPHLEAGDLLIDGGNSHFRDTDRRAKALTEKGLRYLGVGISGGARGAREGASLMPGGAREAYDRVAAMLASMAAKVGGDPCVTYLGPGSAGHYVKMVHNGIEYGLMQLIAESYDLMKRGLGLTPEALQRVYTQWNGTALGGFLIEITGKIFGRRDPETGDYLIDQILDAARQKGTGEWTSEEALALHVPVPTIDMAVAMRNLSAQEAVRREVHGRLGHSPDEIQGVPQERYISQLAGALRAAMLVTYAQGMSLLQRASAEYGYDLQLAEIARIWRGGCIIRAAALDEIRSAYGRQPDLVSLLADPGLGDLVASHVDDLRAIIRRAADLGIPVPALATALAYVESLRVGWLPANLVQAQRDFFGSHTYERIDREGTFHTDWDAD